MPVELRKDRVYFVESAQDQTVRLALAPHIFAGNELRWFDTVRGRVKRGSVVTNGPNELVWQSLEGPRYRITELTLERYNKEIRAKVERSPSFPSTDAMHRFYVAQFAPMIGPTPSTPPPPVAPKPAPKKTAQSRKPVPRK